MALFTGHSLDIWAYKNRVRLFFIEPGKPVQNAHLARGRPVLQWQVA
jgi:hypothetical protein